MSAPSVQELTLFHPPGRFTLSGNPFGKDVANGALFRAFAQLGGYERLTILNQRGLAPEQVVEGLFPASGHLAGPVIETGPLWSAALPARSGVVLRGQPYLSELAWIRRGAGSDSAYSIVGLIHTLAPPAVRESIGAAAVAPVQPWDALVCTSPVVQKGLRDLFEHWGGYLSERFDGKVSRLPELPLIPLAVDVEAIAAQAASVSGRASLRGRLGIADADVLVLWVGRLSYFEKAFPQVMFKAVQDAARASETRVHFALVGWFPHGEADEQLYRQAADAYAPDLNILVLDGNDRQVLAQAWAAADIFVSLVDNIQETFGLAPVEAMAAGLPVVASDWDGYRYTIRDGVDGFLVPTLGSPGGPSGRLLAHQHALGLLDYQTYVGAVAQHTAVHPARAAAALARLITSPDLRSSMGASAQQRARQLFDWPVVVAQYNELFGELARRRQRDGQLAQSPHAYPLSPLRGDPFLDFADFATNVLSPSCFVRLCPGVQRQSLVQAQLVELNAKYAGLRAKPEEALALLALMESQRDQALGCSVQDLVLAFPEARRYLVPATLVWLAKLGLVDWL